MWFNPDFLLAFLRQILGVHTKLRDLHLNIHFVTTGGIYMQYKGLICAVFC